MLKKNFSKLLFGNVGAQVISLAFYPLLTRIYSPTEFGLFGVINSIVQIIGIYSSGQIYVGMLSSQNAYEKDRLFTLSLMLNCLTSLVLLLIFGVFFLAGSLNGLYLLVPFAVLSYGTVEIHKTWAVAYNYLGTKSVLINFNRLLSNLFKLLGKTTVVLVCSEIVANLISSLIFFRYSKKHIIKKVSIEAYWELLKKHKNYPLFFTFYLLSQLLSSEAITIYLKKHLLDSEVGVFYLGNKLFVQTALIVSSTLSYSFSQVLVENSKARLLIYKKAIFLLILGLIGAVVLSLPNYEHFVLLLFGEKWSPLATVLNYFVFLTPIKILSGFFAYILLLSGYTKFISVFKITQFLTILMVLQFGFNSLNGFLKIFVPFEIFSDLVFIASGYFLLKRAK